MYHKQLTVKDTQSEKNLFERRIQILMACIIICCCALLARLVVLQVVDYQHYQLLSRKNQLSFRPIPPTRGLIYDRHHRILAKNTPVLNLVLRPEKSPDLEATLQGLKQLLGLDDASLIRFRKQASLHRPFDAIPLKLKLSEKQIAQFHAQQFRFPSASIQAGLMREYPQGKAMAAALGYVSRIHDKDRRYLEDSNYTGTQVIGRVGIEKHYEAQLHGKVGYRQVEVNAQGRELRTVQKDKPTPGDDLVLSIDAHLQEIAQQALGKYSGAVVALQPKTGEVLALASNPSYDPNAFVRGLSSTEYEQYFNAPEHPMFNRPLRAQYPPASTLKTLIMLQALDRQQVQIDTSIWDPGYYRIPGSKHRFKDWKLDGHGQVDLRTALIISCDTYFYRLGVSLGIANIHDILERFGLGRITGLDMDEELPGLLPSPHWKLKHKAQAWHLGDTVLTSIGQGYLLATPLQLAQMTATLANRGERVQPHLLKEAHHADQTTSVQVPQHLDPVMLENPEHWETLFEAMQGVINSTNPSGTGFRFGRNPPFTVAAKTGTAQLFNVNEHRFKTIPLALRDHSIFIAFASVEKPEIAIAVAVEHAPYAPRVARRVVEAYLKGLPHVLRPSE